MLSMSENKKNTQTDDGEFNILNATYLKQQHQQNTQVVSELESIFDTDMVDNHSQREILVNILEEALRIEDGSDSEALIKTAVNLLRYPSMVEERPGFDLNDTTKACQTYAEKMISKYIGGVQEDDAVLQIRFLLEDWAMHRYQTGRWPALALRDEMNKRREQKAAETPRPCKSASSGRCSMMGGRKKYKKTKKMRRGRKTKTDAKKTRKRRAEKRKRATITNLK